MKYAILILLFAISINSCTDKSDSEQVRDKILSSLTSTIQEFKVDTKLMEDDMVTIITMPEHYDFNSVEKAIDIYVSSKPELQEVLGWKVFITGDMFHNIIEYDNYYLVNLIYDNRLNIIYVTVI